MNKEKFLKQLSKNVCRDGRDAFLAFEGSIEEYFDTHERGAGAFFWCIRSGMETFAPQFITAERVDACAKRESEIALEYNAHLLTPARLDWCAEREPLAALRYAAHLLTPARLDWCAEKEPLWALKKSTAQYLTAARLDWCKAQVA